jgi:hypothetical protein
MKKHTEDFKREAVRIALSSGLPRRRVASDLGVGLSTLGSGCASIGPLIWWPHRRLILPARMNGFAWRTWF